MSTHKLIVVASKADARQASDIATNIADAWSALDAAPEIGHIDIDRLGEVLATAWTEPSAVLVVLGPDASSTMPAKVVDSMLGAMTPGAVMLPSVSSRMKKFAGRGVFIEPWDADPAYLAASLRALCERQQTVKDLCQEMDRLSSFQGGIHGEMTRLHDELNLAAMIQRELLPKSVPTLPGLEFGVLFRPAGYVSGDIYDVSMIGDDRVGFFIADAVGHGVPAALLTVLISRSLRISEERDSSDPSKSLARLNDEMIACQREAHRFATAVAGMIDLRTRKVTIASAGHPPAMRIRSDGHTPIEEGGPLLGVFPDQEFPAETFRLEDDETLLLYSDGFEVAFDVEAKGIREAKLEYLDKLCAQPWPTGESGQSVREAIAALAAELDTQSGSLHQADDLTALALAPRYGAGAGFGEARAA